VLRRAGNPVFGQSGPPGYYLATFVLVFFPFLAFLSQRRFNSEARQ